MEYQVPQFIEVEDKIVGPLTFKQFLYLGGAAGMCVVCFAYLSFVFAVLVSIPIIALAAALSFYKINGKPFIEMLEAGFNYFIKSKLFLWKKAPPKDTSRSDAVQAARAASEAAVRMARSTPKLTRGKLSELAWSLDVKDDQESRFNQP